MFFCSLCTGITNQNGVATFNLTGLTASATYTCSYSNVSDTCTVTVQTYLFYDACDSSSGLSNYGSVYSLEGNAQATLTYDSTMNSYKVQSTGSGVKVFPITALTGLDSLRLSADVYVSSSVNAGTSIGLACVGTNHSGQGWCVFPTQTCYVHVFNNNSFGRNVSLNTSILANEWINITLDVQGTSVGYTITKVTDGTVVKTGTWSLTTYSSNYATLTDRQYAIDIGWSSSNCYAYIKNIIAEPI